MNDRQESQVVASPPASKRLYYLDWLRVLAILMVFLFHAVHPFDYGDWQVKNVEQSEIITIILTLLGIWGMPFFFLVSGAASWFALLRRSPNQYIRERFYRLLLPFIVGTILFSPLELYIEWANRVQRGVTSLTFQQYVVSTLPANTLSSWFTPRWFGYGFHLWFLGFLFCFALITLPLFLWLKQPTGQRFLEWMARLSEKHGTLLLFAIPLGLFNILLLPFFPAEHDWADFVYLMGFFALGFILYADERFQHAIRRDRWILFGAATLVVVGLLVMYLAGIPVVEYSETPGTASYLLLQFLGGVIAVGYCLTMLYVGMRFLDFSNQWLRYGQEAILPFFVLHQPVIIVIAFFVVQWSVSIWVKLPVVVVSSFLVTIGLYELVVKRIRPLRVAFGMKS